MEIEIGKKLSQKVREIEYEYWFDQREFGKIMIIASLSILAISLHALSTINGAVEQTSNATERLEKTQVLIESGDFRQSIDALANTGLTLNGDNVQEVAQELEYAMRSVSTFQGVSSELRSAEKTYQWSVLAGILGLVIGITSIYI